MLSLKRHQDSRGGGGLRVEADVQSLEDAVLSLRYLVTGDVDEMRLPAPADPKRTDELWRHTCFEAFLPAAGGAYYEFNFSPSTRWAAYRFNGYRNGMAPAEIAAPGIEVRSSAGRCDMRVRLDLDGLTDLGGRPDRDIRLTAVIESAGGETSYWATQHAPGKPDFHSFALVTDS
jgi:hypothetical protein